MSPSDALIHPVAGAQGGALPFLMPRSPFMSCEGPASSGNRVAELEDRLKLFVKFALAHEEWEAKLLTDGGSHVDQLIDDDFKRLQRLRNEAVKSGCRHRSPIRMSPSDLAPKTKRCIKCLRVAPVEEFYAQKGCIDGYRNSCKVCLNSRSRQYRKENRKRISEYERERRGNDKRRDARRLHLRREAIVNPEKTSARKAVSLALRDGSLVRKPCEACGVTEKVQAHHADYNKPLDVRWLCFKHHREIGHQQQVFA